MGCVDCCTFALSYSVTLCGTQYGTPEMNVNHISLTQSRAIAEKLTLHGQLHPQTEAEAPLEFANAFSLWSSPSYLSLSIIWAAPSALSY